MLERLRNPIEPDSGERDRQTVDEEWNILGLPPIEGLALKEIRPVLVGSGVLTEIWRSEWALDELPIAQVFQRLYDPGVVSDWHVHTRTTDRLFCSAGRIRLSLYDDRNASPSFGGFWQRVLGPERPLLVVVPPGVWHAVTVLGSASALVVNLVDQAYSYSSPDHWRLPPENPRIPHRP
jgi:dTDP-4-dehydrorhamnose 3,5-epimerase